MFSQISDLCLYSDLSVLYLYLDSNSIFHAHCVGVWFIFSCVPIAFSFASFNLYDWMEVNQMCVAAFKMVVGAFVSLCFFLCICHQSYSHLYLRFNLHGNMEYVAASAFRMVALSPDQLCTDSYLVFIESFLYILEHCFLFSLWKTFLSIKNLAIIGEWRISL